MDKYIRSSLKKEYKKISKHGDEIKIYPFTSIEHKSKCCLTYHKKEYSINIYSCLLENSPLIFILDTNLNRNIILPSILFINKDTIVKVKIQSLCDFRTLVTVLDSKDDILILNMNTDIHLKIQFSKYIKDNIYSKNINIPKLPKL